MTSISTVVLDTGAVVLVVFVAGCLYFTPGEVEVPALGLSSRDMKQLHVGFRMGLGTTLVLAFATALCRLLFFRGSNSGKDKISSAVRATPEEVAGVQLRAKAHKASLSIKQMRKEMEELTQKSVSQSRVTKDKEIVSEGCFGMMAVFLWKPSNGTAHTSSTSRTITASGQQTSSEYSPQIRSGAVGEESIGELSLATIEEAEKVAQFQEKISGDVGREDVDAKLNSEVRLLRFLRGNGGNLECAVNQFRAMLHWRYENAMDEIRREVLDGRPLDMKSFPSLRDAPLATDINAGQSPEGHLYHIELSGRMDIAGLMSIPDEEFHRGWFGMMELRAHVLDQLSQQSKRLQKVVQIRDLSGLSIQRIMRNVPLMGKLKFLIRQSLANWPESIDKVILINVPRTFKILWNALAFLFNARVKSKFHFFGENFAEPLAKVAGQEALIGLARLRKDVGEGIIFHNRKKEMVPSFSIEAGSLAVAAGQIPARSRLTWSFTAGDSGVDFCLIFFSAGPGRTLVEPHNVVQRSCVVGKTNGEYVVERDGVLWASWSNTSTWWSRATQITDLVLTIVAC